MSKAFQVVLVDDNAHEAILDEERKELEAVGGTITAVDCFSEEDIIAAAKDADVLTTDHADITRHIFESLPNLKAVIRRGVGFDVVDLQAATDNGVVVINIPTFCGEEVSNHVLMFLLNIAKKFTLLSSLTKAGKWKEAKDSQKPMACIHGETLGIVGCGRLGQMVAKKAKALGMRVIGYDSYLPQQVFESIGVESVSFNQLLRESDYVTLHVALTDETRHMMNAEAFAKMKPTATLINTSRGPVVDESALIEALRKGEIAGAGLDVFEQEPIDPANPLLAMDNVLVMPHSASYSEAAFSLLRTNAGKEEVRIAQGSMPMNLVNKGVTPKANLAPYQA